MKKISTFIVAILFTFNLAFSQNTHIINTNGMTFSPDTIICNIGDTIIFNLGGYHNAVEVSSTTWIGNGTSSNGGFSFPLGTPTGSMVVDAIKTYYYVCTPHVTMGMKALIISNYTDCNGIVNGSSIMDSCGVCQQSYIYDYVTHNVTMLNDTMNVTLGPTEMLVMANDPQNPYWNSSCTNTIYDIVSNSTDHTTLKTAIDACDLDGVLSGAGAFTLFAPTDVAFNNLPAGTLTSLLNDIPALTDILKHHVVADSVMSSMLSNNQVVTTLVGTDITITINGGNVYIDNALVTFTDLIADNGVVHVIDAVLLPSTSSIQGNIVNNGRLLKTTNLLGQDANINEKEILLFIYENGIVEKRIVIE